MTVVVGCGCCGSACHPPTQSPPPHINPMCCTPSLIHIPTTLRPSLSASSFFVVAFCQVAARTVKDLLHDDLVVRVVALNGTLTGAVTANMVTMVTFVVLVCFRTVFFEMLWGELRMV